jgi:hypothetical protein
MTIFFSGFNILIIPVTILLLYALWESTIKQCNKCTKWKDGDTESSGYSITSSDDDDNNQPNKIATLENDDTYIKV